MTYMEDNIKIKRFQSKTAFFRYLRWKFADEQVILIHGSTARKPVKNFSDFDVEVYGNSIKKPYYEIVLIKNKPALLSTYFYKHSKGKKIFHPKNMRIIKGEYTDAIKNRKAHTLYSEGKYNAEEKLKRQCQLVTDFCFKYFRSRDIKYLRYIQKRIR